MRCCDRYSSGEELREVYRAVGARQIPGETPARRVFYQVLLDEGIVDEIKTGKGSTIERRRLIEAEGPPVSQTMITEEGKEER